MPHRSEVCTEGHSLGEDLQPTVLVGSGRECLAGKARFLCRGDPEEPADPPAGIARLPRVPDYPMARLVQEDLQPTVPVGRHHRRDGGEARGNRLSEARPAVPPAARAHLPVGEQLDTGGTVGERNQNAVDVQRGPGRGSEPATPWSVPITKSSSRPSMLVPTAGAPRNPSTVPPRLANFDQGPLVDNCQMR